MLVKWCFIAMSVSRCYTILGDSNVQRFVNRTTCRSNPLLKAAQIIPCGNLSLLSEALAKVRQESSVCVLSCMTNFLCGSDETSPVATRIEPVISEILAALQEHSSRC